MDTLQGGFEVTNLLTGKIISNRKVPPIPITKEVIDRVEAIAKKDGIKPLLKLKYLKEGTIHEDTEKNDGSNGSISLVEDEDEEEYEPT